MGGKTKTRFDGLDVAAMTALVKRSLIGHKLANVYDGIAMSTSLGDSSGKGTFLFKLANPSASSSQETRTSASASASNRNSTGGGSDAKTSMTNNGNRSMLLIESGVRFHTTSFYSSGESTSNSTPPSQFAMKLRKHLRNLRLESIRQLGNLERVVDFRFGSGEFSHHLILELYGMGNIILTNDKYVILALLRVHEYTSTATTTAASASTAATESNSNDTEEEQKVEQVKVRVGNIYPVTLATTMSSSDPSQQQQEQSMNETLLPTENTVKTSILEMNGKESFNWAIDQLQIMNLRVDDNNNNNENDNRGKKKKKKKKDNVDGFTNLKMLLLKPNSGVFHYGPSLIEHCILCADLESNVKFNLDTIESVMPPLHWERLVTSLKEEGSRILDNFNSGDATGYILYKEKELVGNDMKQHGSDDVGETSKSLLETIPHSDKVFEEFQPHLLRQHKDRPRLEYENFSLAVDEFYSLLEGQKRAIRAEAAEKSARERLEKIKKDQSKRMEGLESEMIRLKEHAELLKLHSGDVDKALGVINAAIQSGMDWEALGELVEVEKANMNPIALLIKKLVLENDSVVLSLPDTLSWDQDDQNTPPIVDVTVSLKEGAYANARIMYEKYRVSKEKATKTSEAAEMALKAAELNAQKQIEQAQKNKNTTLSIMMQPQRKQHWVCNKRFHFFVYK